MAKIEKPSTILLDDFEEDQQALVSSLADIINPALENLYNVSNSVSFANMTWGLFSNLVVMVTSTGSINTSSGAARVTDKFKNPAQSNPIGIVVISATCLDDPNTKVLSQPFIQYTLLENNIVQVQNIQGLPQDKRFSLTLMLITS